MKLTPLALLCAPLLLAQTSCLRPDRSDLTPVRRPPRTVAVALDGTPAPATNFTANKTEPPATPAKEGDQTLKILTGCITQQDDQEKRIKQLENRWGEFLPVTEKQTAQVKEIRDTLPSLQASTEQLRAATASLEKRVCAIESRLGAHPSVDQIGDAIESPDPLKATELAPSPGPSAKLAQYEAFRPGTMNRVEKAKEFHLKRYAALQLSPAARALRGEAKATYDRLIATFPTTDAARDARMALGKMAEEEEDWSEAIAQYRIVLDQFGASALVPNAYIGLGRSLAANEDYVQAREVFRKLANTYPDNENAVPARLGAAECLAKLNRLSEAVEEFRGIERANPGTSFAQTARVQVARIFTQLKEYPKAIATLKEMLTNPETQMPLVVQLAKVYLKAKQFQDARDLLNQNLNKCNITDLCDQMRKLLALAYREDKNDLNAAWCYEDAAGKSRNPLTAIELLQDAGECYLSAQLPEKALTAFEKALSLLDGQPPTVVEERAPSLHFAAFKAACAAGRADARERHTAALRTKYGDTGCALALTLEEAREKAKNGKEAEATGMLRAIIREHAAAPEGKQAIIDLAGILEHSKDAARGADIYKDLIAATKDDAAQAAQYKLRRGLLLQSIAQTDEARTLFKDVAENPKTPPELALVARYNYAVTEQRAGKYQDAIGDYDKVIAYENTPTVKNDATLAKMVENAKWTKSKLKWVDSLQQESDALDKVTERPVK